MGVRGSFYPGRGSGFPPLAHPFVVPAPRGLTPWIKSICPQGTTRMVAGPQMAGSKTEGASRKGISILIHSKLPP